MLLAMVANTLLPEAFGVEAGPALSWWRGSAISIALNAI